VSENLHKARGQRKRFRRLTFLAAGVLVALAIIPVITMNFIPWGVGGIRQVGPYLWFAHVRGSFSSPGGTSTVVVVTNDAGAAHSGNFPSWLVVQRWWGKEVVAKGYLQDSRGPVPLVWTGENSLRITFMKTRHGDEEEAMEVRF